MSGASAIYGRVAPTLAWGLFVLLGLVILILAPDRRAPRGPVAARFLPRNTLLLPSDLIYKDFTGRYIVAPNGVQKDEVLRPEDVAEQPMPPSAPPTELLVALPVARTEITGGINAGSQLQLCGQSPPALGKVSVQFVYCDRHKPDTNCSALVEVPIASASDLIARGFKNLASTAGMHLSSTCT